jgi:hypothetical protein
MPRRRKGESRSELGAKIAKKRQGFVHLAYSGPLSPFGRLGPGLPCQLCDGFQHQKEAT